MKKNLSYLGNINLFSKAMNSNYFRKIPSKFETHLLEMKPHFRNKKIIWCNQNSTFDS